MRSPSLLERHRIATLPRQGLGYAHRTAVRAGPRHGLGRQFTRRLRTGRPLRRRRRRPDQQRARILAPVVLIGHRAEAAAPRQMRDWGEISAQGG